MKSDWRKDLEIRRPLAAALLPPAMVKETGWDILLALYSNLGAEISLAKLASLVSARPVAMGQWLSWLEDRRLVTGAIDKVTGELRAILTEGGRELLDRYLSATMDLEARTKH